LIDKFDICDLLNNDAPMSTHFSPLLAVLPSPLSQRMSQ